MEIHKLITSIWKNEKPPEEWKESIIIPIATTEIGLEVNADKTK